MAFLLTEPFDTDSEDSVLEFRDGTIKPGDVLLWPCAISRTWPQWTGYCGACEEE